MDVFAHGLWTNVMYRVIPQTKNSKKTIWWGVVFGVLPDFASFTPIFILTLYRLLIGEGRWVDGRPEFESIPLAGLTDQMYNLTHSLVIWAVVVLLIWAVRKKFPWLLLGWALHICIDIFSHSTEFFPTPFLYPLSGVEVNGVPWAHPVFMAINYGLLAAIYLVIWPLVRRNKNTLP